MYFDELNGILFVFVGDGTLSTETNKKTGKRSYNGNFYSFYTRKDARQFAKEQNAKIVKIGSARNLRKYAFGKSSREYIDFLGGI